MRRDTLILCLIVFSIFFVIEVKAQEKAKPSETIILDDSLPVNSQQEGEWLWDSNLKFSGSSSHTSTPKEGLNQHSFKMASPLKIKEGAYLIQYVYLDPENPPKGIMLKFNLSDGKEAGVYWEGEEEVFDIKEEEPVWYIGFLPKKGEWVKLDIPIDDLEIQDRELIGISYINYSGKVFWDNTAISEEEVYEDELKSLDYLE